MKHVEQHFHLKTLNQFLLTIKQIDKNRIVQLQLELLNQEENDEEELEEKHD